MAHIEKICNKNENARIAKGVLTDLPLSEQGYEYSILTKTDFAPEE